MEVKQRKNKRERERVKALRNDFMKLKKRLPLPAQAKTQREILQRAAEYIDHLQRRIKDLEQVGQLIQKNEDDANRPSCRYSKVCFPFSNISKGP